jgi:hypothetical protein
MKTRTADPAPAPTFDDRIVPATASSDNLAGSGRGEAIIRRLHAAGLDLHHLVLELTEDPQATKQLHQATGELNRAINEIRRTIFRLHS